MERQDGNERDEMERKAEELMERDRQFVEDTQPPLQGSEETATRAPRARRQPPGTNLWVRLRAWLTGR
ncbi:MAG TPA: hypothetical protein VIO14_10450 [Dehalococcoidia bacterium]